MNHADDNTGAVFIPFLLNVTCVQRALYKGTMLRVSQFGHILHEILFRPPKSAMSHHVIGGSSPYMMWRLKLVCRETCPIRASPSLASVLNKALASYRQYLSCKGGRETYVTNSTHGPSFTGFVLCGGVWRRGFQYTHRLFLPPAPSCPPRAKTKLLLCSACLPFGQSQAKPSHAPQGSKESGFLYLSTMVRGGPSLASTTNTPFRAFSVSVRVSLILF